MTRLISIVVATVAFVAFPLASATAPEHEAVYADGQTYTMMARR